MLYFGRIWNGRNVLCRQTNMMEVMSVLNFGRGLESISGSCAIKSVDFAGRHLVDTLFEFPIIVTSNAIDDAPRLQCFCPTDNLGSIRAALPSTGVLAGRHDFKGIKLVVCVLPIVFPVQVISNIGLVGHPSLGFAFGSLKSVASFQRGSIGVLSAGVRLPQRWISSYQRQRLDWVVG